ncbi:hypothetical protein DDE19_13140 [Micromonospora ureilytica]|uniref:Uncharacterized protein n=1 Tax=Micromonospora ureilytica TaxID=709868 RepID=A0A3N9XV53_9ACTN|nr:hypothetical protein DDE19_13140 [Micromonospora ureilytica]
MDGRVVIGVAERRHGGRRDRSARGRRRAPGRPASRAGRRARRGRRRRRRRVPRPPRRGTRRGSRTAVATWSPPDRSGTGGRWIHPGAIPGTSTLL